MLTSKKKPPYLLLILGAVFAVYVGYLIGGVWVEGMELSTFLPEFTKVCNKPCVHI